MVCIKVLLPSRKILPFSYYGNIYYWRGLICSSFGQSGVFAWFGSKSHRISNLKVIWTQEMMLSESNCPNMESNHLSVQIPLQLYRTVWPYVDLKCCFIVQNSFISWPSKYWSWDCSVHLCVMFVMLLFPFLTKPCLILVLILHLNNKKAFQWDAYCLLAKCTCQPYMLRWPPNVHTGGGGGSSSEQVWTGLYWWPPDVTSRGIPCLMSRGVGGQDQGVPMSDVQYTSWVMVTWGPLWNIQF